MWNEVQAEPQLPGLTARQSTAIAEERREAVWNGDAGHRRCSLTHFDDALVRIVALDAVLEEPIPTRTEPE